MCATTLGDKHLEEMKVITVVVDGSDCLQLITLFYRLICASYHTRAVLTLSYAVS